MPRFLVVAKIYSPIYQRYRWIALAIYMAVLLAGIVDWLYTGLGPKAIIEAPEQLRFFLFAGALLILIGIELLGIDEASFTNSNTIAPLPFVLKLLLLGTIFLVSDLHYSQILFLIIVLHTYLTINKWLSYAVAILGVLALFLLNTTHPTFMAPPPPPHPLKSFAQQSLPLPPPLPTRRSLGALVDTSMGSLITLFFTFLLARAMMQAIKNQQKLEGLNASLETSHKQLQHYADRVADLAATEERNRLARDIHDSLGHHLAAINIQLEKANAYRERDPNRAQEAVKHAQHSVQDALKDVRHSVSSLREEGESFSFDESLDALIKRTKHSQIELILDKMGNSSSYNKLSLMTLYRVIQEGLTNVHKHANATKVNIKLDFSEQSASLEINDNGCGFDVTVWQTEQNNQSFGLKGLQERLSLVGGGLCITSQPQETILKVTIPKTFLTTDEQHG